MADFVGILEASFAEKRLVQSGRSRANFLESDWFCADLRNVFNETIHFIFRLHITMLNRSSQVSLLNMMHLSMSSPIGGRAGIQGLLTSMSCPCLGQVSNY